MNYLDNVNKKILSYFNNLFPKKKFEQSLLISTILLLLLSLVIHYHIYQMDRTRERLLKNKTDNISDKTYEISDKTYEIIDKLDALEINCPACPENKCPECKCPEQKEQKCPDCNCPPAPKCPRPRDIAKENANKNANKNTNANKNKNTNANKNTHVNKNTNATKDKKENLDSIESSNNLFSDFYSVFVPTNSDEPIIRVNKNNVEDENKKLNEKIDQIEGFEAIPGYGVVGR